jgi:predicted methyltransferase
MMKRLSAALVFLAAVSAASQRQSPTAQEIRQAEHDVPLLFDLLGLHPGMTAADVGAGAGAMTLVGSRRLGPSGHLYSTDVPPSTVTELRALVVREGLTNVEILEGAQDSTHLPDACCDAIFLRDVYHHFTNPGAMNRSFGMALRPGGRLAVIDFKPEAGSPLPEGVPANRGGHGINPALVIEEVAAAGLVLDRSISNWPDPKDKFFAVVFHKPQ